MLRVFPADILSQFQEMQKVIQTWCVILRLEKSPWIIKDRKRKKKV